MPSLMPLTQVHLALLARACTHKMLPAARGAEMSAFRGKADISDRLADVR